jgi:membrane protein YdbS with pleckstrin-like domain
MIRSMATLLPAAIIGMTLTFAKVEPWIIAVCSMTTFVVMAALVWAMPVTGLSRSHRVDLSETPGTTYHELPIRQRKLEKHKASKTGRGHRR